MPRHLPTAMTAALPTSDPEPIFVGRDGVKPRVATADRRLGLEAGASDASTINYRMGHVGQLRLLYYSFPPMGDRVAKSRTEVKVRPLGL